MTPSCTRLKRKFRVRLLTSYEPALMLYWRKNVLRCITHLQRWLVLALLQVSQEPHDELCCEHRDPALVTGDSRDDAFVLPHPKAG